MRCLVYGKRQQLMGRPPHCEPAQYTQPAKDRCDRFTLELPKQQALTWKGRRAGGRDRRRRRSSEGEGAHRQMWVRPTHKPAARCGRAPHTSPRHAFRGSGMRRSGPATVPTVRISHFLTRCGTLLNSFQITMRKLPKKVNGM